MAGCAPGRGGAARFSGLTVLLPPDSEIPVAIRLGTTDARAAHDAVRASAGTLHNEDPVLLDGIPAMFSFADPDGNGLVYLEDSGDPEDNDSQEGTDRR